MKIYCLILLLLGISTQQIRCFHLTYEKNYEQAVELFKAGDWSEAESYLAKALTQTDNPNELGLTEWLLSQAIDNQGQPGRAIKHTFKALEIFRELQNENYASDLKMEVARLFKRCNAFNEALTIYHEVLEEKRENDPYLYAGTLRNMAIIFRLTAQYDSALYYNRLALQVYHQLEKPKKESRVLNEIGLNLSGLEQYDQAVETFFSALLKDDSPDRRAKTYNNAGWSLIEAGEFKKAKTYLLVSVGMKESKTFDNESRVHTYNNLAEVYEHEGNLDSARYYIDLSYALVDTVHHEVLNTLEWYQKLYKDDADKLYEAGMKATAYGKRLEAKEQENKRLFDFYQLQNTLHEIKLEQRRQQQERERMIWVVVLSLVGLVSLLIVWLYYRTIKSKAKAKKELLKSIRAKF